MRSGRNRKSPGGPNAEDLERAQGRDEVAELRLVAHRGENAFPEDQTGDDEGGDQQHDAGSGERQRPEARAPTKDGARDHSADRHEPDERADAQNADECRRGDTEREERQDAPPRVEGVARKGGGERDEGGRGHFLDAAPERVAVEEGGLRGEQRGERARRSRGEDQACEPVEREAEERRQEGDVGLKDPRGVLADERAPTPSGRREPSG